MTGLEITLVVTGVIFLIGSFLVKDKLSPKDRDKIAALSEEELKILVEKQIDNARNTIDDAIEEETLKSREATKRDLEKETNEKIMAINEYSDTVLEQINKSHNEIMFLYSMLNDKHKDLTDLAGKIQKFTDKMNREIDSNDIVIKNQAAMSRNSNSAGRGAAYQKTVGVAVTDAAAKRTIAADQTITQSKPKNAVPSGAVDTLSKLNAQNIDSNHNRDILLLRKKGISDVEIAKQLGLGLGEVRLVIGLFEGEIKNET